MKEKGAIYLFLLVIFMFLFALNFTSAVVRPCYNCTNCTAEMGNVANGDTIQMNQSISGTNCITFGGRDNIIFDCGGNYLNGTSTYAITTGPSANRSDNNTIRNCIMGGTSTYSVIVQSSYNTSLINITNIEVSSPYGIQILSSNYTFINNVTSNSHSYGFDMENSYNNSIYNSTAFGNTYGFYLKPSANNNINNVNASGNSYGLYLERVVGSPIAANRILNSVFQENTNYDFYMLLGLNAADADCNNNFTNVNGSGGRAIEYYNYSATVQNKLLSELILCNADGSIVNNITIAGSDSYNNSLFLIIKNDNANISNINSSYNYYGMNLFYSTNNSFTNILTNWNPSEGIYLESSSNNTFNGVISTNNYYGMHLYSTSLGNIFRNMTTPYSSGPGVFLEQTCKNNSFVNINTSYNSYGFQFSQSSNNSLSNITANFNSNYGILFSTVSLSNILRDSYLKYNTNGIGISSSVNSNIIYNNFFNNSINYVNLTSTLLSSFNTTRNTATNIIGGNYTGGNFWATLTGNGSSETCPADSDNDRICDTTYVLSDGINYDYLPLVNCVENWTYTDWSTCVGGTQTRTANDTNTCGTTKNRLDLSQSCTSGGSNPGGGGGSINLPPLSPTTPNEFVVSEPGLDLTKITINVLENVPNVSIDVISINLTYSSYEIGLPVGNSYQAFEVNTTGIDDTKIANVTLNFKVNKTWLVDKNGGVSDIRLYRKHDPATQWDALSTKLLSEDTNYYYFSALSPGLSTFVVFFGKYECQPGVKRCFENQIQLCLGNSTWLVTEGCPYKCASGACVDAPTESKIIYYSIVAVLSLGVIITFYLTLRKINERKKG